MSAPGYDSYRESGVEWPDRVPSHWTVKPLKRVFSVVTERTPHRSWALGLENIEGWSGRLLETETEFEGEGVAFEASDILYGKLRPYLAKVHVAERPGEAVGDFHVLRAHQADVVSRYIAYQLLTREMVSQLNGSTFGARMPRVGWDFMGSVAFAFPPPAEQAAIAAFLDRETGKIDALVEAQTRLIELLKEKRQAVISHAVTKGLDPAAPMKDSGVEWLGQVPAHWEIVAVWMLFTLGRGRVLSHQDIAENAGPYPVYSSQTENDGEMGCISTFDFEGDYLTWTTDGANAGTVFRRSGRFNCTNVCGTLKPKADINLDFFQAALAQATGFFVRHDINPKLMNNVMSGIRVPLPSKEEQTSIAAHVREQTKGFDLLAREAEAAIALLQERRAALISAAVTGKIDVRGLAPEQAEAA